LHQGTATLVLLYCPCSPQNTARVTNGIRLRKREQIFIYSDKVVVLRGPQGSQKKINVRKDLQQLAGGQVANQPTVGGQEFVGGQLVEPDPAHLAIDAADNLASELVDGEKL